jgi:hypothetical protein
MGFAFIVRRRRSAGGREILGEVVTRRDTRALDTITAVSYRSGDFQTLVRIEAKDVSLNYEHLLVPAQFDYRPSAEAVMAFVDGIIRNRHVVDGATVTYMKITKGEPRFREFRNPMTGESGRIQLPTRRVETKQELSTALEIGRVVEREMEYNISVAAEGMPMRPPCNVGYVEADVWKAIDHPYFLNVVCHVRSAVVRVSPLESEEELTRPFDFTKFRPRVDEDCTADDRDGLFVHPEAGAIRIPNAGCAMFWISFEYGKFLFPQSEGKQLRLLDCNVMELAQRSFNVDFVEACNWA